jgi:hypothetical protein
MKKEILTIFVLISAISFAQVGINTKTPQSTFDVVGDPTDLTKADGIIAPRISGNNLANKDALYTAAQTGTIVYVTSGVVVPTAKTVNVTTVGYYYFDGVVWVKMSSSNQSGPKTLFLDATNVTTNSANEANAFNTGADILVHFDFSSHVRLNTLNATVNKESVIISDSGFYQITASLTTIIEAESDLDIFQSFNVEKSSDNGTTWTPISGTRVRESIPENFSNVRLYSVLPTIVTQLQANDRIRLVTFRAKSASGVVLGQAVTSFQINGVSAQGTKGYSLGLTKL